MNKELVKKVYEYARLYEERLNGKNIMFIFENNYTKELNYIETQFLANNFMHLTGVIHEKIKSSKEFYKLCINKKLSYKDVTQKQNGTTKLKLDIFPQLLNLSRNAKVISNYDNSKVNLYTEKLIGNYRGCIGFIKKDKFYLPNTIIKQDLREISQKGTVNKVIAILEKKIEEKKYAKLTYINKEIQIWKVIEKLNIKNKISSILFDK